MGGGNAARWSRPSCAFDKDGDGKLSKAELPERLQNLMATGDTNKDGFLDKAELTKIRRDRAAGGLGGGAEEVPAARGEEVEVDRGGGGPGGGCGRDTDLLIAPAIVRTTRTQYTSTGPNHPVSLFSCSSSPRPPIPQQRPVIPRPSEIPGTASCDTPACLHPGPRRGHRAPEDHPSRPMIISSTMKTSWAPRSNSGSSPRTPAARRAEARVLGEIDRLSQDLQRLRPIERIQPMDGDLGRADEGLPRAVRPTPARATTGETVERRRLRPEGRSPEPALVENRQADRTPTEAERVEASP